MKNKLIKGLFGIGLVCMLFGTVVYANTGSEIINSTEEGNNSVDADVTVGNVEAPVYSADLYWESLSFDWVYDNSTKSFDWAPTPICTFFYPEDGMTFEDAFASGMSIYGDSTCSTKAETYDESIQEYYYLRERENVFINITDLSQSGEIVPSVEWNSSEKYNNVIGKISYYDSDKSVCSVIESEEMLDYALEREVTLYSDSVCSINVVDTNLEYLEDTYYAFVNIDSIEELIGSEIPDDARMASAGEYFEYRFTELETAAYDPVAYPWTRKNVYKIIIELENDPEKAAVTPTSGEVLGTVTITIRAK